MPTSVLISVSFWRVLLERLGRQAAQTAVPILAAVVAAGGAVNVQTVGLGLAGSLAVTLGKGLLQYLAGVHTTPDSGLAWQWLDRAVPAFFGVLVGLWPVDAADLISFDWAEALTAAGSAAIVAVVALYATPPALTPAPRNPDGSHDVTSLPAPSNDLQSADSLDAAGSDAGRSRVLMIVVLAVAALLAAAIPASAHRWEGRGPVVAPRVSSTAVCGGALVVGYDAVQLTGHQWNELMDGPTTTTLELQETSGRSGPGGSWHPVETPAGGREHVLRWDGYGAAMAHGARYTLARVVTGGYRSTGYPVESTCPAA